MTTAAQMAKIAQNLGKQLQAVIEVREFLEELGNLEQAISEAKNASLAATEERYEAEKQRFDAGVALVVEQENLQAAKANTQQVTHEAKARSEQLIAQARETASDTIGKATADANGRIEGATASVQRLEKKRASLAGQIAELEAEYTTLKRGFKALIERTDVS